MDKGTRLLVGSANPSLGAALAQTSGHPLAQTHVERFPDGEVYVRVDDDLEGCHAVIVQSTYPNDNLVELLLMQDAAHEAGANHVTSIVPYFGYSRQDRVFKPGEAVSARAVARAIYTTANHLTTVDPHKPAILAYFEGTADAITAVPQLADELGRWGVDCILAPDAGARDRAQAVADRLGIPFDHLEKTRLSGTEVRMAAKDLDVAGKRVAILDDMIASGGTMVTAAAQLKDQGADKVYAACTHGLFTGGAIPKLLAGGIDRVLCTDTIEALGCDVVSAAPAVAASIEAMKAPAT